MSFWNDVWHWLGFGNDDTGHEPGGIQHDSCVNPANGLPMVGGCGSVDIEGNPYGVDIPSWDSGPVDTGWHADHWNSESGFGSSWDD
jgi:hypothetical protein